MFACDNITKVVQCKYTFSTKLSSVFCAQKGGYYDVLSDTIVYVINRIYCICCVFDL